MGLEKWRVVGSGVAEWIDPILDEVGARWVGGWFVEKQ